MTIVLSIILIGTATCCPPEVKAYDYIVRPGDTLSEITLAYTGTHGYEKIAQQNRISNPDLIYPGDRLTLPSSRPIKTLRDYLNAIYKSKAIEAYNLLSSNTRFNISLDEFKKALDEITFYDLDTTAICADFIVNEHHILQLKIRLNEDPASWGFSLIREKYKWYILLFDLNPTNPQDDGFIEWKCH